MSLSVTPLQPLVLEPRPSIPETGGHTLLERLARALEAEGVPYCQWKGHWRAHRWSRGEGDVDLLVAPRATTAFRLIAGKLGFKLAYAAPERQIPGVESYFGYDPAEHRLLHLHVHYRMVVGDFWRTVYRIPVEEPLMESSIKGSFFPVPAPPFQLILFVFRMILLQRGRPLRVIRRRWLSGIQIQLASLDESCNRDALRQLLARHLPSVDLQFFESCIRSLRGGVGLLERILLPLQLHGRLQAYARRAPLSAQLSAAIEKWVPDFLRGRFSETMRLEGGGRVLALVGGDGSGKSTCAVRLCDWLAPAFPTCRAHLGNPPRSLLTLMVGAALRLELWARHKLRRQPPQPHLLELARHLCTARDRHRLYQKVHRFAARGGIAICERYPVIQNRALVGPQLAQLASHPSALIRRLSAREARYYDEILPPDAVFVLRLDPELAVLRKPEEPADYVRARGKVIWEADWSGSRNQVIDASRPLFEVIRDLQWRIWSVL